VYIVLMRDYVEPTDLIRLPISVCLQEKPFVQKWHIDAVTVDVLNARNEGNQKDEQGKTDPERIFRPKAVLSRIWGTGIRFDRCTIH